MTSVAGEESWLLEDGRVADQSQASSASTSYSNNDSNNKKQSSWFFPLAKQLSGVALGVLLGTFLGGYHHHHHQGGNNGVVVAASDGTLPNPQQQAFNEERPPSVTTLSPQQGEEETILPPPSQPLQPPPLLTTNSKYTSFQALNFQLFTGGAPVVLESETNDTSYSTPNPECAGWGSTNSNSSTTTTTTTTHTIGVDINAGTEQCYLGHENVTLDVADRLAIMYDAVETAYEQSVKDPSTLKVFVAPEFFFRGRNGAYLIPRTTTTTADDNGDNKEEEEDVHLHLFQDDEHGECPDGAEICKILSGLENYIADKRFEDWVFLFGTVIVAEVLPVEDEFDYLFYNFGLLYKGYDPEKESHHGKRFLVPKRYVSTSDFLRPTEQMDGGDGNTKMKNTREIYESTQEKEEEQKAALALAEKEEEEEKEQTGQQGSSSLYVPLRKKYDRKLWHTYKSELEKLDYVMIEYGWFMLDGITLTVEICLDHDLRTALTSFLVDSVLPSPTLIPSSHDNIVEYVDIPRYQAQLSLVASAGMTVSETSMALVHGGSIILQDGHEDEEPDMEWAYECFKYEWQFIGGSEVIQRRATMTPTEVVFNYNVSKAFGKHPIYYGAARTTARNRSSRIGGNEEGDDHDQAADVSSWKTSLRGVFSTAKYEPMIRVFEPLPIAKVF
eukprot:CAMPEP_0117034232 /NCGR_PEP_ID=MMETSP0472-20121206/24390_1 /TAXON_ID=693140 ORGANISM="Tiarina fusus, Strain LIS" /NCGR_SAMPLE_ID=MMETSP0472 /ASSEMBLY_ACC=CAM_ASM_000603 /LENGTH=669 /DNA_ID=CAMNT_0004743351 /DNA_START=101 /DNA_END=2110 /DNA_ORIENTATION=+